MGHHENRRHRDDLAPRLCSALMLYVWVVQNSVLPHWRLIILTDIFHGFPQSYEANTVP
jgi:hypothetical protein